MTSIGKVPDYIELLSFFENTPFFSDELDHRYGYSYTDSNGIKLIFLMLHLKDGYKLLLNLMVMLCPSILAKE